MKEYISIFACVISASLFSCLSVNDIEAEKAELQKERESLNKQKATDISVISELAKMKIDTTFYWIVTDDTSSFISDTRGKYYKGEKLIENTIICKVVRLNKFIIDTTFIYKTIDKDSVCGKYISSNKMKKGDKVREVLD